MSCSPAAGRPPACADGDQRATHGRHRYGGPTPPPLPPVAVTPTAAPIAATTPPPATPQAALSPLAAGLEGLAIDAFFDESYKRQLLRNPEYVTNLGLTQLLGSGNDRLNDLSAGYLQETQELERTVLELLRRYDRAKLTPAQRLTADIYDWYLDDRVRGQAFAYSNYPITPTGYSVHIDLLQFFTDIHPVRTMQEARDYVTRLSLVKTKYEQVVDGLKRRERAGVVLPQFLITLVLNGVNAMAQASPARTPFYTAFAEKVAALALPGDAETQAFPADGLEQTNVPTALQAQRDPELSSWPLPKIRSPLRSSQATNCWRNICSTSRRLPPTTPASGSSPTAPPTTPTCCGTTRPPT